MLRSGLAFLATLCLWSGVADAIEYRTETDIAYRGGTAGSEYAREACRLDLYHPVGVEPFATVVWFHGGGLRAGSRGVPEGLKGQGVAVVAAGYRLHPRVRSPVYVEDAAAAVAWTLENIDRFGGSRDLVFVSGHSAGGYLASMVGYDKRWLARHGIDANELAGLVPYSGHVITHFTIREERGIEKERPVIDDMAPLYHVRGDAPPTLLITGDRELEMLGRYEETSYFWRMLRVVGHHDSRVVELKGHDHGGMKKPAHPLLLQFVREIASRRAGLHSRSRQSLGGR